MTTRLDKTLKRELTVGGRAFIVAVSPEGIKLTLKGKRKGQELRWSDLVSGDAALAAALNASVGRFESAVPAAGVRPPAPQTRAAAPSRRKGGTRPRRRGDGRATTKRR